ncbi:DUF6888 family protein [Pleurocapsa sp. FMAR1]|uniref:DUF6888 family protein n=1 Tax=Pleurocapsa sp. FMAR1 TaxID=3040204 RepID=UPI0029C8E1EA|nr:hypothetical protein [Pleurocapsa sp. FMAR1]
MITAKQALKACILSEFLTSKGLPIRVFRYLEAEKLIRIEAGFRDKQIRIVINENGKAKYI